MPGLHTPDALVTLKLKLGGATVSCPSMKGRTVSLEKETVENSLGRMLRVQEWARALGYPHCVFSLRLCDPAWISDLQFSRYWTSTAVDASLDMWQQLRISFHWIRSCLDA